jgi:hypothetical protein
MGTYASALSYVRKYLVLAVHLADGRVRQFDDAAASEGHRARVASVLDHINRWVGGTSATPPPRQLGTRATTARSRSSATPARCSSRPRTRPDVLPPIGGVSPGELLEISVVRFDR